MHFCLKHVWWGYQKLRKRDKFRFFVKERAVYRWHMCFQNVSCSCVFLHYISLTCLNLHAQFGLLKVCMHAGSKFPKQAKRLKFRIWCKGQARKSVMDWCWSQKTRFRDTVVHVACCFVLTDMCIQRKGVLQFSLLITNCAGWKNCTSGLCSWTGALSCTAILGIHSPVSESPEKNMCFFLPKSFACAVLSSPFHCK